MTHERRRAPRWPLIASAEIVECASDTHLQARVSDLSLLGCYVDMTTPLPVGTKVRLHIGYESTFFSALATVVHSQPNMGMGLEFTDVVVRQREILEELLGTFVKD